MTGQRRRFDCADDVARDEGIAAAVDEIAAARLVVLPTDTVYGVAADAFEGAAVRRLLRAKGRGRDMPPPVLIAGSDTLDSLASRVPPFVRDMIDQLWPGPLTLVCTQQPSLNWDLGDNRSTVAVRMPDHPVALALLQRTGPLAVSSANRTGMPAAGSVAEAEDMLGDRVRVYLDGGPSTTDVSSTILDVTGPQPRVLRQGGVPLARLREFDGSILDIDGSTATDTRVGDGGRTAVAASSVPGAEPAATAATADSDADAGPDAGLDADPEAEPGGDPGSGDDPDHGDRSDW